MTKPKIADLYAIWYRHNNSYNPCKRCEEWPKVCQLKNKLWLQVRWIKKDNL